VVKDTEMGEADEMVHPDFVAPPSSQPRGSPVPSTSSEESSSSSESEPESESEDEEEDVVAAHATETAQIDPSIVDDLDIPEGTDKAALLEILQHAPESERAMLLEPYKPVSIASAMLEAMRSAPAHISRASTPEEITVVQPYAKKVEWVKEFAAEHSARVLPAKPSATQLKDFAEFIYTYGTGVGLAPHQAAIEASKIQSEICRARGIQVVGEEKMNESEVVKLDDAIEYLANVQSAVGKVFGDLAEKVGQIAESLQVSQVVEPAAMASPAKSPAKRKRDDAAEKKEVKKAKKVEQPKKAQEKPTVQENKPKTEQQKPKQKVLPESKKALKEARKARFKEKQKAIKSGSEATATPPVPADSVIPLQSARLVASIDKPEDIGLEPASLDETFITGPEAAQTPKQAKPTPKKQEQKPKKQEKEPKQKQAPKEPGEKTLAKRKNRKERKKERKQQNQQNTVSDTAAAAVTTAVAAAKSVASQATQQAEKVVDAVEKNVDNAAETVAQAVKDAEKVVETTVKDVAQKVTTQPEQKPKKKRVRKSDFADENSTTPISALKNAVENAAQSVVSRATDLAKEVSSVASQVKDTAMADPHAAAVPIDENSTENKNKRKRNRKREKKNGDAPEPKPHAPDAAVAGAAVLSKTMAAEATKLTTDIRKGAEDLVKSAVTAEQTATETVYGAATEIVKKLSAAADNFIDTRKEKKKKRSRKSRGGEEQDGDKDVEMADAPTPTQPASTQAAPASGEKKLSKRQEKRAKKNSAPPTPKDTPVAIPTPGAAASAKKDTPVPIPKPGAAVVEKKTEAASTPSAAAATTILPKRTSILPPSSLLERLKATITSSPVQPATPATGKSIKLPDPANSGLRAVLPPSPTQQILAEIEAPNSETSKPKRKRGGRKSKGGDDDVVMEDAAPVAPEVEK
jgi:hypothetical protein